MPWRAINSVLLGNIRTLLYIDLDWAIFTCSSNWCCLKRRGSGFDLLQSGLALGQYVHIMCSPAMKLASVFSLKFTPWIYSWNMMWYRFLWSKHILPCHANSPVNLCRGRCWRTLWKACFLPERCTLCPHCRLGSWGGTASDLIHKGEKLLWLHTNYSKHR